MKKFLRFLIFVLLVTGVLAGTYNIYKLKDTDGTKDSALINLKKIDRDLIDVFFVGSSHVYCSMQPGTVYRSSGVSSYNLSISGMDRESSYSYTKYETKYYQPKVVVVDIFSLTFDGYSELPQLVGNKYRNMLQMPLSKEEIELHKNILEKEERRDYLLKWPFIHTRYRELTDVDFDSNRMSNWTMGGYITSNVAEYIDLSAVYNTLTITPLSDENKAWVEKFVELSKERGFELLFVRVPYSITEKDEAIIRGFEEYARQKGYAYLDLCKEEGAPELTVTDFSDAGHLNLSGGKKLSTFMGKYLKEHYSLENHKKDPLYDIWEKSAQYVYMQDIIIDIMNSSVTDSPFSYINNIQGYDSIGNIVIYTGAKAEHYEPLEEYLEYLGIEFGLYENGGAWLLKGNEIIDLMPGLKEDIYYYDIDEKTSIKLNNKADASSLLTINQTEIPCQKSGLTILTYDYFDSRVIVNKQYN